MISLLHAMNVIRSVDVNGKPIPFSIQFVKADRRRKAAGEVVTYRGCTKSNAHRKSAADKHAERLFAITSKKDPHHNIHGTINITHPETKKILKLHIRLITALNDQRVIY